MASAVPVSQLNVRLPQPLRENGDAALAQIGYSPSAAIKKLWEKASKRGRDLDEVAALFGDNRVERLRGIRSEEDEVLLRGWQIVESGMQSLGQTTWSEQTDRRTYEDELVDALRDRLIERATV